MFVYCIFITSSPWLVVGLYKMGHLLILNMCPFDYTACAISGSVGIHHSSWMVVVTPINSPKSVRNRCVIEVCGGVFVLPRLFFYFLMV